MTCPAQTCTPRTVLADEVRETRLARNTRAGRQTLHHNTVDILSRHVKRLGRVFELFVQDSDGTVHGRLMDRRLVGLDARGSWSM